MSSASQLSLRRQSTSVFTRFLRGRRRLTVTLEERRHVQDLAQIYKMVRGKEKLSRTEIFKHVSGGRTRQDADELNLKQAHSRLDIRKNFFTQRVIKSLNAVPRDIKRSTNVTGFKAANKSLLRNGPGGMQEAQRDG
jgi:hypothetical protein